MKRQRGFASLAVLCAVGAVAILLGVVYRARTNDLAFEERSLARAQAHWAAESAVARVRGRLYEGRRATDLSGQLEDGVRYSVKVRRIDAGYAIEATGEAAGRRGYVARARIEAEIHRRGGDFVTRAWREPSTQ